MRGLRTVVSSALAVAAAGCGASEPVAVAPPPPPPVAALPPPVSIAKDGGAADAANGAAGETEEMLAISFRASLGDDNDLRIALDRDAKGVARGMAVASGEVVTLTGTWSQDGHVVLAQPVVGDKSGVSFDGRVEGGRLVGEWRDPPAKPMPIAATRLAPFEAGRAFTHSYVGSLGATTRIRAQLTVKADGKASGVYRYPKSQANMTLLGKVDRSDGTFVLDESAPSGAVTGRIEGIFLGPEHVFARWTSPDRAKTFPVMLRDAPSYPEILPLGSGGKIVPQEDSFEEGRLCSITRMFPRLEGTAAGPREKALNAALKREAGGLSKDGCQISEMDLRYEAETTYAVTAQRKTALGFRYQFYEFSGGAHGMHGISCPVADLKSDKLVKLTPKMLTTAGRATLLARIKKELLGKGSDAASFGITDIALGDETTLCVDHDDLVVQFQVYEIGPYAMGAPTVKVPRAAAHALFTPSPLVDVLFK